MTRNGCRGAAVVPPWSHRKTQIACDFHAYSWRHLIKNASCSLQAFRRVAMGYDKTDASLAAA